MPGGRGLEEALAVSSAVVRPGTLTREQIIEELVKLGRPVSPVGLNTKPEQESVSIPSTFDCGHNWEQGFPNLAKLPLSKAGKGNFNSILVQVSTRSPLLGNKSLTYRIEGLRDFFRLALIFFTHGMYWPNIVIQLRPGATYHAGRQPIGFPVRLRWRSGPILASDFMPHATPMCGSFPGKCLQISCGAAEESSPGREPGVQRASPASSGGAAERRLSLLRSLEASGTPNPQLTLWATFCRTSGARNQVGRRSLVGTGVKTLLKAR